MEQPSDFTSHSFLSCFPFPSRLQEMEILYKKEKEEADLLLEQQRLVGVHPESSVRKRAACSHTFPVPQMSTRPMAGPAFTDTICYSLISLMENELTSPGNLSLKKCP